MRGWKEEEEEEGGGKEEVTRGEYGYTFGMYASFVGKQWGMKQILYKNQKVSQRVNRRFQAKRRSSERARTQSG